MLAKILKPLSFILLIVAIALALRYFSEPSSKLSSAPLYAAKLTDTFGKVQNLGQYQNKIIVLNFWATWCSPCREEMPELMALQQSFKDNNLIVLGIALDEPALVADYLKATPVNYPIFVSETAGSLLGEQLGNDKGVLPYTVIINADGEIVNTYFGRINKPILEATIKPLISP